MVKFYTLFAGGVTLQTAVAQKATPKAQDKVSLGEPEVKQLMLLMDTDQNGKVSQAGVHGVHAGGIRPAGHG
jgi:hypothetical protein